MPLDHDTSAQSFAPASAREGIGAALLRRLAGKLAAGRLTTAGLGDTQPVGENATEEGRARNRRVVLIKQ